jgi:predicted amidohydrolase YtcJ
MGLSLMDLKSGTASLWRAAIGSVALAGLAACTTSDRIPVAPALAEAPRSPVADMLITNARVYTVDTGMPWAEAVAISGGKVAAVGSAEDLGKWVGPSTRVVDLGGRLLMPAFGDLHVHPVFGGMSFSRCSLHDGKSIADYQRAIAGCISRSPGAGPIYGVGWGDALFPPNGVPRKELLDAVSKDRVLIFESVGGHSYWVNSEALKQAGITRKTPDPANGHIDRDPKTGEPVGGLQESAMELVKKFIPEPTPAEMQSSIAYVAKLFNSLGITSWHDAGIDLAADGSSAMLDAYRQVKNEGKLTSHVTLAFKWANDRSLEQIPTIVRAAEAARASGLKADIVKYYVDGVIPQRTAAMIEPYAGSKVDRGKLQIAPEVLNAAVTQLAQRGMRAHVHAIGDGATRAGLDAFQAAGSRNGTAHRPMISHLNVIDPADQPRFGELGAIAVFQPTWSSNYPYMDLTKQAIGAERSKSIYPAGAILRSGGMLAYGADWPVATANPLPGLQVAVTRVNFEEPATAPLLPEQGVPLAEAVRAHTLNVAIANGLEDITGSVQAGTSADLIVLDQNIFTVPAMNISQAKVIVTLFQGAEVFGSLDTIGGAPAN